MDDLATRFAEAASRYCAWCEGPPGSKVEEARTALDHVSLLYRFALRLRELEDAPDAEGERMSHEQWHAMYKRFDSLPFNHYATVFDPRVANDSDPEASTGDLADDLADIYRDLRAGLDAFDVGAIDTAEYEWAWSFRHHWGRHAASALHALHCWFADETAW